MELEKPTDASEEALEYESYVVHPAGLYRCRLEQILNLTTEFGASLKFVWKITDGELKDAQLSGLANKKLLPKSKLSTWAKAHLNLTAFPPDFVLKLSSLIGREVFLLVATAPRKDGQGEKNTIVEVMPVKQTPAGGTANPSAHATPSMTGADDYGDLLSGQGVPDPREYDYVPKSQRKIQE